jgi:hypothetical protein
MALTKEMISAGVQSHRASAITGTVRTGLTAAGTTIADAAAIPAAVNVFGTVAASTGAILPRGDIGDCVTVRNGGANALLVYPPSATGVINALSAGAGFSMATGKNCDFRCVSADGLTWIAVLSA